MSAGRAMVWVSAIAVAGMLYIISVVAEGGFKHNGAWVLMVIVFVAAGGDVIRLTLKTASQK